MKFTAALTILFFSCSANAVDTLEISKVENSPQCISNVVSMPMPCVIIKAMIEKMKNKCGSCGEHQTCAVRT